MGLKILHTADWHLDAPFSSFPEEQRAMLRREQQLLPGRIARLCRQESCDMVLIAGDLFDGDYSRQTAKLVFDALEECAVPVFISPGNHDYVAPGSPWTEELWPENVHIFTGGISYVDLPEYHCRVYGAGYNAMDCPPLLADFRAEGEGIRIGLFHGDPTRVHSPYCPVTAAQAEQSGLDYLALGHIHKAGAFRSGDTLCVWPGCPMGRGWDETGDKGICIVTFDGKPEVHTVTLDTVTFIEQEVSIGTDALAALRRVLPAAASSSFFRISLTGTGSVDLDALYAAFPELPNLELRDRTEPELDLWEDAGADSLRGVFFRMLRDAAEAADPAEAEHYRLAAEISKKLLDGREVLLP